MGYKVQVKVGNILLLILYRMSDFSTRHAHYCTFCTAVITVEVHTQYYKLK